jgi:hypothetical protein
VSRAPRAPTPDGGAYLYALLPPAAPPPDAGLPGVGGAPVVCRLHAGLAVWISPMERRPAVALDAIREHNRVVEAAMAAGVTPVPVRFGHWHPAEAALLAAITAAADRFREALAHVADAVEYGIRVVDPSLQRPAAPVLRPEAPEATTGSEYMQALALRHSAERVGRERVAEVGAEIRAEIGALIRDEHVEPLASPHGVASVAHLVHRRDGAAYAAAVERLPQRMPELRFLLSGPWAPYSFVA